MKIRKVRQTLVATLSREDSRFFEVHRQDAGCTSEQRERWLAMQDSLRAAAEKRKLLTVEVYAAKRYGGHQVAEIDV
jgi:hypothetical protein